MKKALLLIISLLLALALCACGFVPSGGNGGNDGEGGTNDGGNSGEGFDPNRVSFTSAYNRAKDLGFEGTLEEFIELISGKDGADGKDGVSVASVHVNEDGKLIVQLSDDTTVDCGKVVGKDGKDGKDGVTPTIEISEDGYWVINGEKTEYKAVGSDGEDGADGEDGYNGRGIKRMWLDEKIHLWVEYDDGSAPVDLGYVGVTTTEPAPATYTVTFVDYNGTELKKETVESGNSANAPTDPTRAGYRFTGWDVVFSNITSNTTVTAQYIQQFTVTFKDYNGDVLKTQTIDKGASATPPATPSRDGYEFASWIGTYTNVTTNQVVTATYAQTAPTATYTVTFYDYDGTTVLGTSTVAEGKAATPPTNPTKSGTTFLGWNGNYANVMKNEDVVAVYDDNKNVFTVESATGRVGDTVTLLVSVDGTVKTCGFDITIYYDNAILELVSYDSDLDLDVVVNAEYLDNGVLLNFSAATEKTKSREIIELTFRIKDTTSDATNVSVEMTSIKEMDGSTIIDSTCEFVDGVVTIQ